MADLKREVRVLAGPGELARAAADELLAAAYDRDRFTVALSGGSTPRALYRLLAGDPYRDRLRWDGIHFFWGDERHVPPDHPDSNFRMAREALLDHVPVPPGNIHRIAAEEPDAAVAAARYEAELRAFFHLSPGEPPRFDLVLLGLGADGHTASLFPGTAAVHETEKLVVAVWVEAQKAFRITLTPAVLNAAARVIFLVSGEEKAAALAGVIGSGGARYPAQVVRPENGAVSWLVDCAAARELESLKKTGTPP